MFQLKKKLAATAAVLVTTPLIVVGAAGAASASDTVTWATGGQCMQYEIDKSNGDTVLPSNIFMGPCSSEYSTDVYFVDVQVVPGVWLEHPHQEQSLCLTGYKHRVYFEKCQTGNNWERWQEISSGGNWYLLNVAENEYLNADPNGNPYTSSFPQGWH